MAQSLGFEVRGARSSSANFAQFRGDFLDPYLLRNESIAVKVGDQWRYYDPGNPYLPAGMVRWDSEGQFALMLDAKNPELSQMPASAPAQSATVRQARMKLTEDGTLEGAVKVTMTGHAGDNWKKILESLSEAKREERIKDMLKGLHGDAEASEIKILNVTDPAKPFEYSYSVAITGYGQRTGKRVFFQPGFFQHGIAPRFTAPDRVHPVRFQYPFMEDDNVEIELPAGYTLESPEAPGGFKMEPVGEIKMSTGVTPDGRKVVVKRNLVWGDKSLLLFTKENYGPLKQAWDAINRADQYSLTVRAQ
jgi:hypothetical protein